MRGSSQAGKSAKTASRGGSTAWWTTPARERRLRQQGIQDGAGFGGGVGSHADCLGERTDVRNGASLADHASRM